MKKLLTLLLFVVALNQTLLRAQCPPGAFAYQSAYPQCPTGCGVLLLGWPEGVLVNIYGGAPLTIITSTVISGTLGGSGTGDAFTCVPCNTPLIFASTQNGAVSGCVIATIGVVPVKMSGFRATALGSSCQLSWSASAETGKVEYTIQKSNDGRNFSDIGSLAGKQMPLNEYSYTDQAAGEGTLYYRVKATEISGAVNYTPTAMVYLRKSAAVSIYPNPSSAGFNLSLPAAMLPATVELLNAQGVRLSAFNINQPLSTLSASLPKGLYTVKVTGRNQESAVQRIIKN